MTETAVTEPTAVRETIRLEGVSKRYPGQDAPAVEDLTLGVRDGEIVVLLGPSGCGKTTTLRLINRLIEPTAGRILLGGEDVTRADPDELRRRIGYVIQQVGLFPHMTIAANIGVIPRTLGWPKGRIRERVDELLDMVGLDPGTYRGRYPKELSGGEQQRVGVARALAADPPAMLMDEPFGAIDPITRERLQDAFLDLQGRIRKTIVLVTHDLTEALKLGDRIAMLGRRAKLVQYDTPARILAEPADEFVASFVGAGAAMRRLRLVEVGSIALGPAGDAAGATVRADQSLYEALDAMLRAGAETATVLDGDGRPAGTVSWSAIVRETPAAGGAR
ncbi:osmoprotectant transport system ATP-binding protein [Actinomadura meyerae]|uniref:ABC-type quaternary amine transporter n=1 Tax=Actinomadura meyerae TaxID=240840 RepID=A0A239M7M4_9ACTN|nr:ABC transporter ATP-binding protein [Actinomadura meyerae]SNT38132.1 osmoprotectant transport system ATP-binding protein [Actinomadura meyerae]